MNTAVITLAALAFAMSGVAAQGAPKMPGVNDALASRTDLWGEIAMKQPNGASYELFADVVPPLRYVNAAFKHYPIVLSPPGGAVEKFLLVSNGSGINLPPKLGTWHSNIGISAGFFVGPDQASYGEDLVKLEGPRYAKGYLPIVRSRYKHGAATIDQEVFAAVDAPYSTMGAALVRFSGTGEVCVRLPEDGSPYRLKQDGVALDKDGRTVLLFSPKWKWDPARNQLTNDLSKDHSACLALLTNPGAWTGDEAFDSATYDGQRQKCEAAWQGVIDHGMRLETPESVVNNAWRSQVIGTFIMQKGDALNYSWGNQYECMYEAECGDAALALLQFGYSDDVRRMLPPLLDFQQGGLLYHNAAYKLQLLEKYYWLTRDMDSLRGYRPRWSKELTIITDSREKESGLLPKERYCGDIGDQVYTLNSNANCWRALRDLAPVLEALGEKAESDRVLKIARGYRQTILKAVDESIDRGSDPPFIPVALFGYEKAYPDITSSTMGSYWNLLIPYVLGSGVFPKGSGTNASIIDYLHSHGGLCMGMIRFDQHSGLFANEKGVDDLYTLRYALELLRQDDAERALVSFYGKLAHGLTHDTFIGGEGSSMVSSDGIGRDTYLPPCSSGNGFFLQILRNLMVQDWDLDDDGAPDTLRLMFATPRRWLEDGKSIRISSAPTAFGDVSAEMRSGLRQGKVIAKVACPTHKPTKMLLRARVPDGWRAVSASLGERKLSVDARGTVDISGSQGSVSVEFAVERE